MPGSLEIEDIPGGGKRFSVPQAKWTPLKVALIPLGVALLLAIASYPLFTSGYWTLALIAAGLAAFAALLAIPFGIVLLILSLTLRDRASFSVAATEIRIEGTAKAIDVADIISIHHGRPRSSSGVEIGIAGDVAGLMGLAFAGRSSAVWLRVGHQAVYLARQIRPEEAARIFEAIKPIVRLA